MKEAVSGGHKFVFIIDNLDRINEAEALQIWGTIKGFFLGASDSTEVPPSHYLPTVILPIDPVAIVRMFQKEHGGDGQNIAQAFMDKTFDISFEVPEPIGSDWRAYLSEQLASALGARIQAADEYWVAAFLDEWRRRYKNKVTPRVVNKYINSIVALHAQRASDEIGFPAVAFYAAFARDARDDLLALLRDPPSPTITDPNWRSQVAGIHYGVEPTKGLQVLLDEPLRDSLRDGASSRLEELSAYPGFTTEVERVLRTPLRVGPDSLVDFGFVTNAALLLQKLQEDTWVFEAWRSTVSHYLEVEPPASAPSDFELRVLTISDHVTPARRRDFLSVTANMIGGFVGPISPLSEAANALLTLGEKIVDLAASWEVEPPTFLASVDAKRGIALLARLWARPSIRNQFRLSLSGADATSELVSRLPQPLETIAVAPAVRTLVGTPSILRNEKINWNTLTNVANERLRNQAATDDQAVSSANVLGVLRSTDQVATNVIEGLIDQGFIVTRINEASSSKKDDFLAPAYAFLVMHGPDFGPPSGMTWPSLFQAFPNLPDQICDRLLEYYGPEFVPAIWVGIGRAPTAKPLFSALITSILKRGSLGALDAKTVVDDVAKYLDAMPPEERVKFLGILSTKEGFWAALGDVPTDARFLRILRLLRGPKPETRSRAASLASEHLNATTAKEWAGAVEVGGIRYSLGKEFGAGHPPFDNKSELHAGLIEVLPQVLKSTERGPIERWFTLRNLLDEKSKKSGLDALGKVLAAGGYLGNLLAVVRQGGAELLKSRGFARGTVVRSILVPLLSNEHGRRWMFANAGDLRPIVKASTRDATATLEVELDRLQRSRAKSRQKDAEKLRGALL